ncbi:hypothetical protein CFP56_041503, partial [Quercus suber]
EKLYQWIRRQQEEGSRVTTVDILNYIQNELDYCGEEPSMSPRVPHYHITRGGYCPNGGLPLGNGARNNEPTIINNQSRDSSALSLSSNDSAMDMHADSPAHEFIY